MLLLPRVYLWGLLSLLQLFLHIAKVHMPYLITPSFYGSFLEAMSGQELLFPSNHALSVSLGHQPLFSPTDANPAACIRSDVCVSRHSDLVLCCVLSMCHWVLCRVLRWRPLLLGAFQPFGTSVRVLVQR